MRWELREIWRRLKRDRDIGRKAVLSDVKTTFTCTPALMQPPMGSKIIRIIKIIRQLKQ